MASILFLLLTHKIKLSRMKNLWLLINLSVLFFCPHLVRK